MLETMKKSKQSIVSNIIWLVILGLIGLLFVAIMKYIVNISERHPKVFSWISVTAFVAICVYNVCVFLVKHEWNVELVCICMVIAINGVLYKNNK